MKCEKPKRETLSFSLISFSLPLSISLSLSFFSFYLSIPLFVCPSVSISLCFFLVFSSAVSFHPCLLFLCLFPSSFASFLSFHFCSAASSLCTCALFSSCSSSSDPPLSSSIPLSPSLHVSNFRLGGSSAPITLTGNKSRVDEDGGGGGGGVQLLALHALSRPPSPPNPFPWKRGVGWSVAMVTP